MGHGLKAACGKHAAPLLWKRSVASTATAICLLAAQTAQTAQAAHAKHTAHSAPVTGEPATIASRIWDKILTRCGDTYFYAGSVFDGSGMLNDVQVAHQKTLQYKGVRFHIVPIRVTDAERANGIAFRGRISMVAHLYREEGGSWQDGPDLQPRNVDDIFGRVLSQTSSDMFDMGGAGAMALQIVKFKGIWAVERSSVDSTSELAFGSHFFEVEKVLAADTPRYSCPNGSGTQ